jgi:ferrous iron transport protein B
MNITMALAGNPNSGKTTLFNALTGSNQYVGNWPGVTVEKKEGKYKKDKDIKIMDLPGVYSLSPYTLEEVVTRNYLIDNKPDVIINIIDGSNLERNLYLTTQLLELSIPVVLAINMMDIVNKRGDIIDVVRLSKQIGCPVKTITALTNEGVDELMDLAINATKINTEEEPLHVFNGAVEHTLAHIEESLNGKVQEKEQRWYAIKILERDKKILDRLSISSDLLNHLEKVILKVEKELDDDSESIVTNARYEYIGSIIKSISKKKNPNSLTTSDKIDRIVTNRWLGLPIFIMVIWFVYWISVSTVGDLVTGFTNDTLFGEWILPWASNAMATSPVWLSGLVVDGIISGVGAVLGFVPQIMVLFFLLALLEQSGYMARIAFVLDRVFRKFGLSGKSFIPMLIGTGCSIPGIMASRTIENQRDRRILPTIL